MKAPILYHIIVFLTLPILLWSCGSAQKNDNNNIDNKSSTKNKNNGTKNNVVKNDTLKNTTDNKKEIIQFDKSTLVIDTTLYLNVHHIIIGKEKIDPVTKKEYSKDDLEYNPVIIYFTKKDNDSVILKKKFDENWFAKITSFQNDESNYITLISYGGGSGYVANIYKMDFSSPGFIEVASYSELSSVVFSKDGNQLLIMNGIWDMGDEIEESHFSDHRYQVSIVDLSNHKFKRTTTGTSIKKYPSMDEEFTSEKLLKEISENEPQVFKGIDLDKYSF